MNLKSALDKNKFICDQLTIFINFWYVNQLCFDELFDMNLGMFSLIVYKMYFILFGHIDNLC